MSEPAWIIRVIWRRLGLSDNSILEAPPCLSIVNFTSSPVMACRPPRNFFLAQFFIAKPNVSPSRTNSGRSYALRKHLYKRLCELLSLEDRSAARRLQGSGRG